MYRIGNNDRVANVTKSKQEDHDHKLVEEVRSFRVFPACIASPVGTATPKILKINTLKLIPSHIRCTINYYLCFLIYHWYI